MKTELKTGSRFLPLLDALDAKLKNGRVLLAVEGGSASGKSTLAASLGALYDCTVFHADDFFLQAHQRTEERLSEIGGNLDRERLKAEVLLPLSRGEDVLYRRFDCKTMTLSEPVSVRPKRLVILEGAYSMHPELQAFHTLSVFLKTSKETQRARIEARNTPESAARFFSDWIPMENRYFEAFDIERACDFSVLNEE